MVFRFGPHSRCIRPLSQDVAWTSRSGPAGGGRRRASESKKHTKRPTGNFASSSLLRRRDVAPAINDALDRSTPAALRTSRGTPGRRARTRRIELELVAPEKGGYDFGNTQDLPRTFRSEDRRRALEPQRLEVPVAPRPSGRPCAPHAQPKHARGSSEGPNPREILRTRRGAVRPRLKSAVELGRTCNVNVRDVVRHGRASGYVIPALLQCLNHGAWRAAGLPRSDLELRRTSVELCGIRVAGKRARCTMAQLSRS